ncbi:hypothetical protein HDU98_001092 [Podochytrium sp. JEL0797]|nr:hypothetical protein HDU98_001092 [Podochytrium sp. JEL0797]
MRDSAVSLPESKHLFTIGPEADDKQDRYFNVELNLFTDSTFNFHHLGTEDKGVLVPHLKRFFVRTKPAYFPFKARMFPSLLPSRYTLEVDAAGVFQKTFRLDKKEFEKLTVQYEVDKVEDSVIVCIF